MIVLRAEGRSYLEHIGHLLNTCIVANRKGRRIQSDGRERGQELVIDAKRLLIGPILVLTVLLVLLTLYREGLA